MYLRMRILAYDLIHLIYNLVYPALLGTFFYELFFSNRTYSTWSLMACWLVIVMFSLDFVWGKKFYEWLGRRSKAPTNGNLWALVIGEALVLLTLSHAFNATSSQPIVFLQSVALFGLVVLWMFLRAPDEINFAWLPGFLIAVLVAINVGGWIIEYCLGGLIGFRFAVTLSYLLTIVYYLSSTDRRWQLRAMLPSGTTVE